MTGDKGSIGSAPRSLNCRSFWKAGASEAPSAPARVFQDARETGGFDRARVHPMFLHTNATCHKWAFGAIAELLDNAVNEIRNGATYVKVDKSINPKDNSPMLVFQDDGGGMTPEGVRKCMSLGFPSKKSKAPIGHYGNGFKTSTMRLGADAIVFTRAVLGSNVTLSVGLLSYTFLRKTVKDDVAVPMINFENQGGHIVPLVYGSQGDWDSSLKTILDWSPFFSKEELVQQFEDIDSHGTKVVIYNLWMNDDGLLELDFNADDEDILLRDQAKASGGLTKIQKEVVEEHISHTLRSSLRAYASVLYLKKYENFQIILRGKPVEHISVANDLKFKKVVTYEPRVTHDSQVVSVRIDIGFTKKAPVLGIFGMNVYHKNRLIMPFWKVHQEGSLTGGSIVGVLEANFIEPAHDKQDFERTPLFIQLEKNLRQTMIDYWKERCHLIGYQPMDLQLRSQFKDDRKDSGDPEPKVQHKSLTDQRIGGRSSNLLPETYDDAAVVALTDNADNVNFHELVPVGAAESRPFKVPLSLYQELKGHQQSGLSWLWKIHCSEISGGLVADDMGLGKTRQTTTFLAGLFYSGIISRVMIIAPVSILTSWKDELEYVGLDQLSYICESCNADMEVIFKDKGVLLTSYEMYCKKHATLGSSNQKWDYVILDEAHRIKNLKSQVTMAMNSVKCMKKVLMTGTPLSRDLEDIYALVNFIQPDVLGSEDDFHAKFILPIEKGIYADSSESNKKRYLKALAKCRKLISPFLLRRNKSVLIESGELLCKKHDLVIWLKLTDFQIELYKNLYKLYGPKKYRAKDDKILSFALSKLSQLVALDPCLLLKIANEENSDNHVKKMAINLLASTDADEDTYSNLESSCKMSFVVDLIENMLKEDKRERRKDKGKDKKKGEKIKILVFSQYIGVLDILEESLSDKMIGCHIMRIDGSVPRKQRDAKIKEFKSVKGPVVFLLSAKVGGEGLNLVAATRVIIVDPSYNISDDNQISDRVYRIGQKKDVIVYRLFTCSTIEEHIYNLQLNKGIMAQAITEGSICASLARNEDGRVLVLPDTFEYSKTYKLLERKLGDDLELGHKHHTFLRKHRLVKGITDQSRVFSEAQALPDIDTDDSSEDETTVKKKKPGKRVTGTETSESVVSWSGRLRSHHPVHNPAPNQEDTSAVVTERHIKIPAHKFDQQDDVQKIYVPVPRDQVGRIIGSGGKRVMSMESLSGAQIRNISTRTEAKFEVAGTLKAIKIAKSLILDVIQKVNASSSLAASTASSITPGPALQGSGVLAPSGSAGSMQHRSNDLAGQRYQIRRPPHQAPFLPPSCYHSPLNIYSPAVTRPVTGQCHETPRPPKNPQEYPYHPGWMGSPVQLQHYPSPPGYAGQGYQRDISPQQSPFLPPSCYNPPLGGYSPAVTRSVIGHCHETPRPPSNPQEYPYHPGWIGSPVQQQRYPGPPGYGVQPSPYLGPPHYAAQQPCYPGTSQHSTHPGPPDYTVQQARHPDPPCYGLQHSPGYGVPPHR